MSLPIPLNAEQCANLPFPPGCPVWWYPQKQQSAEEDGGNNDSLSMTTTIMKRGVIKSAALHNNGAQLFYQVEYNNNDSNDNTTSSSLITEEVADTRLSFGASCPVTIVSNNSNNDSSEELLGEIVMSEPASSTSSSDSNKIVYTAMIFIDDAGSSSSSSSSRVRYESGIDAERIKYRKVDENANNNNSSTNSSKGDDDANAISASTKDTNCKKKSSNDAPAMPATILQPPPVVPASITCSDSVPSKRGAVALSEVAPSSSNNSMAADSTSSRKRDRYSHPNDAVAGSNGSTQQQQTNVPRLEITVPLWLQKTRTEQRQLFFHLIGNQNMNRINQESRCKVSIKINDNAFEPLKIHVDAVNPTTAPKDLTTARRMIQDLFLEYVGNDDGARGRLIYEIASSCWGAHRPNNSTSNAVREVNPLVVHDQQVLGLSQPSHFHTIVNLFSASSSGSFGSRILQKAFLQEISALGCGLILVAEGFRVSTQLCDPYVLVYGRTYQDVDRAVEMLKQKIRNTNKFVIS